MREPKGDIPQLESRMGERLEITHEWVLKTLMETYFTKSCGTDELHPRILKELAVELPALLTALFNPNLSTVVRCHLPTSLLEDWINNCHFHSSGTFPSNSVWA